MIITVFHKSWAFVKARDEVIFWEVQDFAPTAEVNGVNAVFASIICFDSLLDLIPLTLWIASLQPLLLTAFFVAFLM